MEKHGAYRAAALVTRCTSAAKLPPYEGRLLRWMGAQEMPGGWALLACL